MDVLCLCVSPDDDDDKKFNVIWTSIIQLVTSLLVTLKHMFVPHAVDFIGVHQETIARVCIKCLIRPCVTKYKVSLYIRNSLALLFIIMCLSSSKVIEINHRCVLSVQVKI